MKNTQDILFSGKLDAASIDGLSASIAENLESMKISSKEILKFRLCAEDVLNIWSRELGSDVGCQLQKVQRTGMTTLVLHAAGKSVDPTKYQDDLLLSVSSNPNMVTALGLPAEYRYSDGINELKIRLPKKKPSAVRNVVIAIVAAFVIGLSMRFFAPEFGASVTKIFIEPLMNTITNLLRLVAGPLVFLSILCGISGIGDASSFGKIGGALTKKFVLMMFLVTLIVWLSVCWMFPVSLAGDTNSEGAISSIVQLILGIVPSDIVSPFQSGNTIQIIFLSTCIGIAIILLSDNVNETVKILNQVNAIVQSLMSGIGPILPVFIFLCITDLVVTSDVAMLSHILLPLAMIIGVSVAMPLIYGIYASIRSKMPLGELLKAQMSTYFIALTTASSAAAFSTNVECCEKSLHIDEKLVQFGVPFGQVLFMPGAVGEYVVISLYMAKQYGVEITPVWIITMLIVVAIMAMAAPPVPGSALSTIVVLFTQLGIPIECMAVCAVILTFSDYFTTSCSIACLQQELLINAKKMNMMNNTKKEG